MIKLVTIVGARPQFIKASSVSRAIQKFNQRHPFIQEVLVHTGQHYDYLMDKVFFEELRLTRPDYHLGVGSGSHASQTGMMLERIEPILQKEKPEVVLVYGDTNSTLAGALAAAKLNIPIAHIEAGLRSYNRVMPEEINRLLTDHLSSFLFCPTARAVRNLLKEGIKSDATKVVKRVGDVMYDSILYYSKIAEKKSTILEDLNLLTPNSVRARCNVPFRTPNSVRAIHELPLRQTCTERLQTVPCYYLATLHRAENTDHPKNLKSILKALKKIGEDNPVILPLHPRTKKLMKKYHLVPKAKGIKFIEPVSYFNMLKFEKNAKAILTDSGGVQKEAYWFKVPCLTLREETEWVETVQSGWNILVGTETKRIIEGVSRLKREKLFKKKRGVFGDGKASQKIVQILGRHFG